MDSTGQGGRASIILNIDDVGLLASINRGAMAVLRAERVVSVSLMAPAPWLPGFLRSLKDEGLTPDLGVHLCLTSEWPGCRLRPLLGTRVTTLLDENGFFPSSVPKLAERADRDEVRKELRAQIAHVQGLGVRLSHLDTHMVFYEGGDELSDLLFELATDVRLPLLLYNAQSIEAARARGLACPDFGTLDNYGLGLGERRAGYQRILSELPCEGIGAMALHPCEATDEARLCMGREEAERRQEELDLFSADLPIDVVVLRPRNVWGMGA